MIYLLKHDIFYRNEKQLPLRPSIQGLLLQSLAIGSVLIPKLILVSNTLIFAPYVLPATMLAELFIIVIVNSLLFGTAKGIIIFDLLINSYEYIATIFSF